MGEKENRIKSIVKIYYSNPKVQNYIFEFAKDRESIPSYMMQSFGKRPDMFNYPSEISALVKKGATSFHVSEEIWKDPLQLSSDMGEREMKELRKGWDLLIDIDSPFLDYSKVAAKLIIAALENHGVKNISIKFSGSKGFHLIVPWKAFPEEYNEELAKDKFPEWPRAICQYLMHFIRQDYNRIVGDLISDMEIVEKRTKIKKEDLLQVYCTLSNKPAKEGLITSYKCSVCGMEVKRKDVKITKRKLKCLSADCPGELEVINNEKYYYCDYAKDPENEKFPLSSDKYPEYFEKTKGVAAEKIAALDLVLVAPRHLFRAPYSLHEKTSLASVVLKKEEIDSFNPKDADPMKVKLKSFYPNASKDEAKKLLVSALEWKKNIDSVEEKYAYKDIKGYSSKGFLDLKDVSEDMFPKPIKKLLKGLEDGKKRGLFVLITFLRSINYNHEKAVDIIKKWNEKNKPPLKEGYVRSQISWHFKQKKKILPPNYDNDAFYRDIGILEERPNAKNPLVEVSRKIRNKQNKSDRA